MVYPVWVKKKKKRRDYKVGVAGAGRRYMGSLADWVRPMKQADGLAGRKASLASKVWL
jgi:hypothetical protein